MSSGQGAKKLVFDRINRIYRIRLLYEEMFGAKRNEP